MFNPRVHKPTKSVWYIRSKTNKKWNCSGAFIYKGMKGMPLEVGYKFEELKVELGEPPSDIEWGFRFGFFRYYFVKFINWVKELTW